MSSGISRSQTYEPDEPEQEEELSSQDDEDLWTSYGRKVLHFPSIAAAPAKFRLTMLETAVFMLGVSSYGSDWHGQLLLGHCSMARMLGTRPNFVSKAMKTLSNKGLVTDGVIHLGRAFGSYSAEAALASARNARAGRPENQCRVKTSTVFRKYLQNQYTSTGTSESDFRTWRMTFKLVGDATNLPGTILGQALYWSALFGSDQYGVMGYTGKCASTTFVQHPMDDVMYNWCRMWRDSVYGMKITQDELFSILNSIPGGIITVCPRTGNLSIRNGRSSEHCRRANTARTGGTFEYGVTDDLWQACEASTTAKARASAERGMEDANEVIRKANEERDKLMEARKAAAVVPSAAEVGAVEDSGYNSASVTTALPETFSQPDEASPGSPTAEHDDYEEILDTDDDCDTVGNMFAPPSKSKSLASAREAAARLKAA